MYSPGKHANNLFEFSQIAGSTNLNFNGVSFMVDPALVLCYMYYNLKHEIASKTDLCYTYLITLFTRRLFNVNAV